MPFGRGLFFVDCRRSEGEDLIDWGRGRLFNTDGCMPGDRRFLLAVRR
jgi:hypothetical protein